MTNATKMLAFIITFAAIIALGLTFILFEPGHADAAELAEASGVSDVVVQWAMIGAAISAGISSLAAGYAVAAVGSASIGALAEKPELFGRVLVMVGLAEGIAIYGLIIAILILNRAG